jgi:hypothetical protein
MAGFGPVGKEQVRRVFTQTLGSFDTEGATSHSMNLRRPSGEKAVRLSPISRYRLTRSSLKVSKCPTLRVLLAICAAPKLAPISQQASTSAATARAVEELHCQNKRETHPPLHQAERSPRFRSSYHQQCAMTELGGAEASGLSRRGHRANMQLQPASAMLG